MRQTTDTTATRSSESGFTLIEALIAIVILAFGMIAITNLMIVSATSNSVAHQSTAATAIASQTLENLKAAGFNDATLAASPPGSSLDTDTTGYFSDTAVDGVGMVHTRWVITDLDTTTKFIAVRSEGTGVLARIRSRAEFTTFRTFNPTF
jgi:prepilin-type N-terminal cleavage/methylation domain-containing protein